MKGLKTCLILLLAALLVNFTIGSETGSSCSDVEDCPKLHTCQKNICVHKELFPITFREAGGTFFILILNAVMTAGGVGGGAAYVPYIMLIFEQTLKQSIFIAYTCVFGGGLGNLVNLITLKNPKTNRYMPNYNINMVILPALMIGVVIGVLINRMLPPFVTNLVLLAVLGFSLYKNFYKLKANLKKEKNEKKIKTEVQLQAVTSRTEAYPPLSPDNQSLASEANRLLSPRGIPSEPEERKPQSNEQEQEKEQEQDKDQKERPKSISSDKDPSGVTATPTKESRPTLVDDKSIVPQDNKAARLEQIMKNEQKFPFHKVGELLINVVIIIIIGIIRGSKSFEPVVGVDWTCGWDFLWFGLAILFYLLNLTRSIYLVHKWQKEQIEVGYEFLPEDPILTRKIIITLIIGSIVAGIIGAIVALGGAIILGPILLDMGLPPASSAATTGVFMIFAMFNTMFSTILDGRLSGKDLAWYLPLAFTLSLISAKVVSYYVKKTGRQSTVIASVMTGVLLGFVCVFALWIKGMADDFHAQVQFKSIC